MATVFRYEAPEAQPARYSLGGSRTSAPREPLAALIEGEVIPRLMMAHARGDVRPTAGHAPIESGDVELFVARALSVEADSLLDDMEALLARGVGTDALLVDLFAPVARRLGELWESDACDFVDVTMALWRLQQLVHDLAARRAPAAAPSQRVLFSAMPGDQHEFGTLVIDEVFRLAGWDSDMLVAASDRDILDRVASGWFDVVGLTVSRSCHIARLPSLIHGLRGVSGNPRLCVLVGGPAIGGDPVLAMGCGADGTAVDARQALRVAENLVASARALAVV